MIGALLSYGIFYIYGLISDTPMDDIFKIVSFGTFIVLFAGAIAYPLLYMIGRKNRMLLSLAVQLGDFLLLLDYKEWLDI